jgi:3-methylfumaryl-CoA hydratase
MIHAEDYAAWIGRQETQQDHISKDRIQALAATLDVDFAVKTGTELPPLWHWILFNPVHKASALGHDGHARKGGFLPPIDLPRRMWAGGRFEFIEPLKAGDTLNRVSTIKDIAIKNGKSGQLAFVTVQHDIRGETEGHWVEEHDIVYREAPNTPWQKPDEPVIDTEMYDWSKAIKPDPILLFRYSALTFNGHRIHYDREYCQREEGYPGLIVHGPLTATLLLELLRPSTVIKRFKFKALQPLFDHLPYSVHGRVEGDRVFLWAKDSMLQRAMEAEAWI